MKNMRNMRSIEKYEKYEKYWEILITKRINEKHALGTFFLSRALFVINLINGCQIFVGAQMIAHALFIRARADSCSWSSLAYWITARTLFHSRGVVTFSRRWMWIRWGIETLISIPRQSFGVVPKNICFTKPDNPQILPESRTRQQNPILPHPLSSLPLYTLPAPSLPPHSGQFKSDINRFLLAVFRFVRLKQILQIGNAWCRFLSTVVVIYRKLFLVLFFF